MYYWYPVGTATGKLAATRFASITVMQTLWFFGVYIGFFLSATAVITSYVYRKQRVFPTCMASFVSVIDFLRWTIEMIKFSNIAVLNEALRWSPNLSVCVFLFAYQAWIEIAAIFINMTLATIIYLCVVKRIDMGYAANKKYFIRIVCLFFFVTTAYTAIIASLPLKWTNIGTACTPNNPAPSIVSAVLTCVSIVYEIILIGISIKYTRTISRQVQHMTDTNDTSKIWFLIVRLTTIILLQNIPRLSNAVYKSAQSMYIQQGWSVKDQNYADFQLLSSKITTSFQAVCYWLNSIFTIATNRQLRKTIRKRWNRSYFGAKSHPYKASSDLEISSSTADSSFSKEVEMKVGITNNDEGQEASQVV